MDATILRFVLLVAGLIFLGGIYLYETRRRKRESTQARRRLTPKMDHDIRLPDEASEPEAEPEYATTSATLPVHEDDDLDPTTELLDGGEAEREVASFRIDDEPIPGIDQPAESLESSDLDQDTEPVYESSMEQQDLFAFSAREESPADVPDLIIQINVRAKQGYFDGPSIEQALQESELKLAKSLGIYQRLTSDGKDKVLYRLASMVEPGVFPKSMADFTSPGLLLFAQLPGPSDGMMIFTDMLYTAERLAAMLGGDLQDESHSALTKQTIEHLRERIMEHKRQIQLARRKG